MQMLEDLGSPHYVQLLIIYLKEIKTYLRTCESSKRTFGIEK